MELFIYVIGIAGIFAMFWIGYELHRLRAETKLNYVLGRLQTQIETNRAAPQLPEPQLFDQEQP